MQQSQHIDPQRHAQRPAVNNNRPRGDPLVEERISRLLNQMRHGSVASSQGDGPNNGVNGGSSAQLARQKKDEEDMDEDERLLASEEGKKLSSKERRQLRNKVSARAFRSRRKGKCIRTLAHGWFLTVCRIHRPARRRALRQGTGGR
jgi:hypothetical protein